MMDIKALQTALLSKGYGIGTADGVAGAKTYAALLGYAAKRSMTDLLLLGKACAVYLDRHDIDTPARLANFIGQACHESGGWRYLRELWGPTPAQRGYEGRKDLGNTQPGDGHRFMGRGIFQVTGRANYADMAARMGLPLTDTPSLLELPDNAVWSACLFWQSRGLSALADAGQEDAITRRINGGTNGIDERRAIVARVKGLLT
jgi:putative chitinase